MVCSIFLITATNTFIRFIRFSFGRDYEEYLRAESEKAQLEIVDDGDMDAFVYMESTKWFNLQSGDGRRRALCHVLALLRWHDQEQKQEGWGYRSESSFDEGSVEDYEAQVLGDDMDTGE